MSNKGCVDCAEPWPVGDEACNCLRADARDRRQAGLSGGPRRLVAGPRLSTNKDRYRPLPTVHATGAVRDRIRGEMDSTVSPPNRIGSVRNCTVAAWQLERRGFGPQHCSSELEMCSRQLAQSSSRPQRSCRGTGRMQFAAGFLQPATAAMEVGPARRRSKPGRIPSGIARQQSFVTTAKQESASAV